MRKIYFIFFILFFLFIPNISKAFAHEIMFVNSDPVIIEQPTVSKSYFDTLMGQPRTYVIYATDTFKLDLTLNIPLSSNPNARYTATIEDTNNQVIDTITSDNAVKYFEPFAGDTYLGTPLFSRNMPAGNYKIVISGNNNIGKYVLAVGSQENLTWPVISYDLKTIPMLKSQFFMVSPITFVFSIIGFIYLIVSLIAGIVIGIIWHKINSFNAKKIKLKKGRNIGSYDRSVRLMLGIVILGYALITDWNFLLMVIAGFCFYEALSSWCGFYALLGKNTCEIKR